MRKIIAVLLLLAVQASVAQEITLEDIWLNYKYYQRPVSAPMWMKNSDYFITVDPGLILKKTTKGSETVDTLFENKDMLISNYELSFDEQSIVLQGIQEKIYRRSYRAQYFIYDIKKATLDTLTHKAVMHGKLSPDGYKFAYVFENNLYVKDLKKDTLIQVTNDGKINHIINGSADWVYEEEFMFSKAFFWSPDSKKIAFYRFDESQVPEYNMQLWGDGLYPQDYKYKYPKAGEEASSIQIKAYNLEDGITRLLKSTTKEKYYIPSICWADDEKVSITMLNRKQNKLWVYHADIASENVSTTDNLFFSDDSETYIELEEDIHYAKEEWGNFIYINEQGIPVNEKRTPYKGIEVPVTAIKSIQDKGFYYEGISDKKGLERNLYYWENGQSRCVTCHLDGTNEGEVSPDGKYVFNKNSTINRIVDYTIIDVQDIKQPIAYLNKMRDMQFGFNISNTFQKVELTTIKNDVGDDMNAYIIKPKDFKKKKKYPVIMYVYGGPGHQLVENKWQGINMAYHQLYAQKGFVVVCVDGRGTGGKGEKYKKCTYKQLGKLETEDQIAVAKYLATLPYVDPARIGIWGWSYGGYLSSLAVLKGSDVFKAAVAVAPVTNWKYYDNIYTERYMQEPQYNEEGYEDNSPLNYVHLLKGKYLLIHGTADDNVHFQNAMSMQKALINANKQFDVFYYPDRNHGIYGGNTRFHLYKKMMQFFVENL